MYIFAAVKCVALYLKLVVTYKQFHVVHLKEITVAVIDVASKVMIFYDMFLL